MTAKLQFVNTLLGKAGRPFYSARAAVASLKGCSINKRLVSRLPELCSAYQREHIGTSPVPTGPLFVPVMSPWYKGFKFSRPVSSPKTTKLSRV